MHAGCCEIIGKRKNTRAAGERISCLSKIEQPPTDLKKVGESPTDLKKWIVVGVPNTDWAIREIE